MSDEAVGILVDVPALSRPFDYLPPLGHIGRLEPGTIVRVTIHGRRVDGWVVGPGTGANVPLQRIKKIRSIGPTEELLSLASFAAWRWAGPITRFLKASSPEHNVYSLPPVPPHAPRPSEVALRPPTPAAEGVTIITLGAVEDPFDLVLDVITRAASSDGSVIVATPTVAYAQRLSARLERAGCAVARPGPEQWSQARAGWPVVVGVRGVAFAPVPRVAAVVVLDAHEHTYTEEATPTWNAVEVLVERARLAKVPAFLITPIATATLSFNRAVKVAVGSGGSQMWPKVTTVDLKATDRRHRLLTEPFVDAARQALAEDQGPAAVVCLYNRTGRAKLLACKQCDALAACTDCGSTVTQEATQFVCPSCHSTRPIVCAGCGGLAMKILRPGVSRLAEELRALLQVSVDEVTASGGTGTPSARVVVGTEAVLHRVRHSRLVAVLDLDQHLLAPRFSAEEDALALLVQAGRLVGARGSEAPGTLLLQTRQPDHEVVRAMEDGTLVEVLAASSDRRRRLSLPPHVAHAALRGAEAAEYGAAVALNGNVHFLEIEPGEGLLVAPTTQLLCDALAATPRAKFAVKVAVDAESI